MTRRAVAINVGANTDEPGVRGPVDADGPFTFVPIPESEPTSESVPTYGDLASEVPIEVPTGLAETRVHLDPTFAEYPYCSDYTYGDPHPVKAGPLSALTAGDRVYFYATLAVSEPGEWLPPAWGAFLNGQFTLARAPVTPGGERAALPLADRARFAHNAHRRRSSFDARVLLAGDPEASLLYDQCIPLSRPTGGTRPNRLVTGLSTDSGAGPWWRRPLRFDRESAAALADAVASGAGTPYDGPVGE